MWVSDFQVGDPYDAPSTDDGSYIFNLYNRPDLSLDFLDSHSIAQYDK